MLSHMNIMRNTASEDMVSTEQAICSYLVRHVRLLGKDDAKVIVCHIGNGASISASIGGKCVDTSMGLTPLEGLFMGTRSGDVDPAVVQFICNHENISVDEMLTILNKKSGLLGISGCVF